MFPLSIKFVHEIDHVYAFLLTVRRTKINYAKLCVHRSGQTPILTFFTATVSISHINHDMSANNSLSFEVIIFASLTQCQSFHHVHNKHKVSIHFFQGLHLFSVQTFATSSLISNCFILHHQIFQTLYFHCTIL